MEKIALMIIDMQRALVEQHPENEEVVVHHILTLLKTAREAALPVVYVAHDGGKDNELAFATNGWEFIDALKPQNGEPRFDKTVCNAFSVEELHAYLQQNSVTQLMIVGMRTEFCVDATVKGALELDYNVTIPEDCTTSFGNEYITGKQLCKFYEHVIWKGSNAQIIPFDDAIAVLASAM